ncbi:MAG: hypothetical protein K6B68_08330 [Eubacterium sp.]|nr:hypothetical protein [Eubacterium sp.]
MNNLDFCFFEDLDAFVDYRSIEKNTDSFIPEINTGFLPLAGYVGYEKHKIKSDEFGVFYDDTTTGDMPLSYQIRDVENGNYLLDITIAADRDLSEAYVFTGRRRLCWFGSIKAGERKTVRCIDNVTPIIPRYHTNAVQDSGIDVTVLGEGLHLSSISYKKWDGKTIYIAGDSTVTDQTGFYPYYPKANYNGWGQMLPFFTKDRYAVSNHAHSGLTTESFKSEGHYKVMLDLIKEGDICLFQFGHNDQKITELAADSGYRRNLINYIENIRSKKAVPVIVTPLARNTWFGNRDEYNDLLSEYDRVCYQICKEMSVSVIDLHKVSMNLIMKLGRTRVRSFFYPGDYTHSNDFGGYLFAGYIYDALLGQKKNELSPVWNPPDELRKVIIENEKNDVEVVLDDLFQDENKTLKRYEALEIVIKALKFFPTNVFNDLYNDIVGHEVYAGYIQCAYQNGILPDYIIEREKFMPEENITVGEFLDYLINGYRSRYGKVLSIDDSDVIHGKEGGYITRKKAVNITKKYCS